MTSNRTTGGLPMADPPRDPAAKRHTRPRWVKVAMIIGALVVLFVILSLVGVLPGGPGRHGPGRHFGGAGNAPASSEAQGIGGVGEPAQASHATRTVEVTTLDTMTFEPSRIDVAAGETVTFSVTNTGQDVHEFTLGNAAMQREHAEAMAHMPAGMAHETPNSITLEPGDTKQLTWRFSETATVEYACHQPGHYQAGMRGQIMVT
jgi:uncharacterized cupredoxin-like copper-binding protein